MSRRAIDSSAQRRSRAKVASRWLATFGAVALSSWWLWPGDDPDRVIAAEGLAKPGASSAASLARSDHSTVIEVPVVARPESRSGVMELSAELRRRVLELSTAYEERRAADDPVGADAARLRFLELLNDETARGMVCALPPEFLASFFGDLALRRWAARDRAAAAAWMAEHPVEHPVPAAALAHDWVTQDLAGLHAYLDSLPAGAWRHLVAKAAGEEALVADRPAEALALMEKVSGSDPRRDELREWAVTKWAIDEPAAAATWAADFGDRYPELNVRLLAAAAVGRANRNPEEAARWLVAMTDNAAPPEAFAAIARLWTKRDPEAAARWATSLPAGALREAAETGLLAIAAPELSRD